VLDAAWPFVARNAFVDAQAVQEEERDADEPIVITAHPGWHVECIRHAQTTSGLCRGAHFPVHPGP